MVETNGSLLLGERTNLLHIGPHKTATSAVQAALFQGRRELERYGVYVPRWYARRRGAGWAMGLAGRPAGTERPPIHLWTRLVDEVNSEADKRVVVSNEDFGRATPEQVRTLVDGLGGGDVHVVAAVRNFDRLLPSVWQERIKAGIETSYEDWLRVVLGDDPTPFERRDALGYHDVEAMVERWVEVVGADRFTLMVLDDNDPGSILRTFEKLLGLPEALLQTQPGESNRGLSYSECELVRAINAITEPAGVPRPLRERFLSQGFVFGLKHSDHTKPGPKSPAHPRWAWEWIRDENERRAAYVKQCGVRVIGDPDKLRVMRDFQDQSDFQPDIPLETIAEAAAQMLTVAIDREREALDRVAQLERELAERPRSFAVRARGRLRRLRNRA